MKLLPIVTALFALLPLTFRPVQAQNNTTLERLMSTDGITVVYLSSSMLSESSLRFSGSNGHSASLHGLVQAVNSVYIFSAADRKNIQLMRSIFTPMIKMDSPTYEQLFFVKEDQRTMHLVGRKKGNEIHDLYLLVDSPEEYVAISFIGKFTRKQIEEAVQSPEQPSRKGPLRNR